MANEAVEQAVGGEVSVKIIVPPDMPITYGNWCTVQSAAWEIRFTFCQVEFPFGDVEQGPDGKPILDGKAVARIAMPPAQALLLYQQLGAHLQTVQAQLRQDKAKG